MNVPKRTVRIPLIADGQRVQFLPVGELISDITGPTHSARTGLAYAPCAIP